MTSRPMGGSPTYGGVVVDLDEKGCEYGRITRDRLESMCELVREIRQDVKELLRGSGTKNGNGRKEFWASLVALATSLVALAFAFLKAQ